MLTEQTALYLSDLRFRTKDVDDATVKLVECVWTLEPFTAVHADAFGVKGRLFSLSDGEPLADLSGASLDIQIPQQRMEVRRGPDQARPSVEIAYVDIDGRLVVKRDDTQYCATFKTRCDYPVANALLLLAHGVKEQHFVTFAPEQPELADTKED